MKKSELIADVKREFFLTQREASIMVELFFKLIENSLISGEDVEIRNFGKFVSKIKHNGETSVVKVKFRASKNFLKELNEQR